VSTLAKIFVVVNFALAVAFLVFTLTLYSKRVKYFDEWKKCETKAREDLVAKDKVIAKLEADKTAAVTAMRSAQEESARDKASAKEVALRLEATEKKEVDARNTAKAVTDQNDVLIKQVEKMRDELAETRKTVMALKETNVRLQMDTDEYKNQLVTAQNDNNTLKGNIEDLNKDRTRIAQDLANAEYMLKQAIKDGWKPQVAINVPDVRTKVVDVRSTGNVALGAGSDSGIKEGTIFLIHRKDEYIGKIRVTTVWNDFAGGQVIEQKKPIMPGDDAMSSRGT
jgi:hypothetical protein